VPSFSFINTVEVQKSPRVQQMAGMFDVSVKEKSTVTLEGNLDIDDGDWQIGLIAGPSGSGKTSVARHVFGDNLIQGFDWPSDRSILDAFPEGMSIKEITGYLSSVGFGTAPNWLRPFRVLSNGEQFRISMARALAEDLDLICIDEFTSVVDRQVAKTASHTIQKAIRRSKKKLVAVSCHFDIVDWLQPDWIYQPELGSFDRRRLRRRPSLELEVYKIDKAAWSLFSKYHYLNHNLHKAAQCFGGFINGQCVAFTSYLHFARPSHRNIKKGHRLVVHPDWQGLGIGGRLSDWLGQYLYEKGFHYYNTVAHPAMIAYHAGSPRWKLINDSRKQTRGGGKGKVIRTTGKGSTVTPGSNHGRMRQWAAALRNTKTFSYVPPSS